jgi:hypothetical protein
VSFFDNADTIENNFGILVGLTRADLDRVTQNINYRQAVAGLMFAYTRGPEIDKIRLGAQILLGLPFSEHPGIIRSVDEDYRLDLYGNPVMGRILIEDTDSDGNATGTLRVYTYPIDFKATELTGIETSPVTGKPYTAGDSVKMFTALCKGVEVLDYLSSPLSVKATAKQQLQQFHSFRLRANDNIFNLNELTLVSEFLRKITPSYISYALQASTSVYDRPLILDLVRFGLKVTGTSGSTFADDVATGLATPFMYDYASLFGGKYLYWDDGAYVPRLYGSDLQVGAVDAWGELWVRSLGSVVDQPLVGEGPVVRYGDKILIITGVNQGLYTLGNTRVPDGLDVGTDLQILDAPAEGFKPEEDLSFILLRPVTAELCRGAVPELPYGSPETPTPVRELLLEPGLRRDGVMPGDWIVGGWSNEGPTTCRRYTIREVKESVPGSGAWDTVVIDQDMMGLDLDGGMYDRGFDYRIYRPNLIAAPFLESKIEIYPDEGGPFGNHYTLRYGGFGGGQDDGSYLVALLETGDEIVLEGNYPTLTLIHRDGWISNSGMYLDQILPVNWGNDREEPYTGYIKKRGHNATTVGLDSKMLFPHDQVTVDLIAGTGVFAYVDPALEGGSQTYWSLNNTPSEGAVPRQGDQIIITPNGPPADPTTPSGLGYDDLGYGPGVYPILSVDSDVDWVYLNVPTALPTADLPGVTGFAYRIRRVLLKTPTATLIELPAPTSQQG